METDEDNKEAEGEKVYMGNVNYGRRRKGKTQTTPFSKIIF